MNKTIKQATYEKWAKLAKKELGDKALSELHKNYGGLNIKPIYFAEDLPKNIISDMPSIPPFTRGIRASMYANRKWTIRQYAGFSTAKESNKFYKSCLEAGQKGLSVAFDLATHRGYDSDHERVKADVGKAGVAIDSVEDMKELFKGIDLSKISVSMTMNGAVIPTLAMFIVAANEQGIATENLAGTIQNDILKEFMVRNTYIYPPQPSMRIVGDIIAYMAEKMPKFNSISISGYHMHEAGASAIQELAFTLANGIEYVRVAQNRNLDIDNFAPRLSFFFAIGMNFFIEIAKLRAARKLWADIMEDLGALNPKAKMLRTHCQTSGVSLSEQDPYNNIVRTAFEALSAVLGGTQSLHTNSFDEAIALPSDFSARIARNTQLILQHETGVSDVVDPLAGSYFIENLTEQLVSKAGALIKEIEENGGMIKAVSDGSIKQQIEIEAALRQTRIDRGEDIIVGVNRYLLEEEEEEKLEIRKIDNEKVRKEQIAKLKQIKASRNQAKVDETLAALKECAAMNEGNLLSAALEAAKARATLGEISFAMEEIFTRFEMKNKIISGIFARQYKNDGQYLSLTKRIKQFQKNMGQKPAIFIAKMGQDGHDRGAKIIASAFVDLGFTVHFGALFETAKEVAEHVKQMRVDCVGVSSLSAGHRTLVPELIRQMKKLNMQNIPVIVGGVIPQDDYEFLYRAGVSEIFGPGTNILEAAFRVMDNIEGKLKNR